MVKQNWKTSREHSKYSDPVGFATKFWCPKTTHMYSSNQRHAILAWFCNKPQFLFETLGPSPIVCFVCLSLTEKKTFTPKTKICFHSANVVTEWDVRHSNWNKRFSYIEFISTPLPWLLPYSKLSPDQIMRNTGYPGILFYRE